METYCDIIYAEKIFPTLKSLGLNPIKVDNRQHREDLNVFIINMLEQSEIALVDLTYARPSVYYELDSQNEKSMLCTLLEVTIWGIGGLRII